MQPLRGKVQAATVGTIVDATISTPVLQQTGTGKALVMAVDKIYAQMAMNDLQAAGNFFVIAGIGTRAFVTNADFDLSKKENIFIEEISSGFLGTSGGIIWHQVGDHNYSPPFLIGSQELHLGAQNQQNAGAFTFNVQIWYHLVAVDAGELIGLLL